MKLGKQITDLEMENMDKKRELIKSMIQVAVKMQKELSFTNPATASDEDAFALMITDYFGYDGKSIKEIAYSAFEDANFHSFNEKFERLWDVQELTDNYEAKIVAEKKEANND